MSGSLITSNSDTLTFHATMRESYTNKGFVTEHPVASARTATDNRQRQQTRFEIVGIISATPIESDTTVQARDYVYQLMYDAVQFLRDNDNEIFTWVSTKLGRIENVMIDEYEYEVNGIDELTFNIQCRVIDFAFVEFVSVPRRASAAVKKHCGDQGTVVPPDTDGANPVGAVGRPKLRSIAAGIDDKIGAINFFEALTTF